MARILVHAAAATAGGGVTYLKNFLRRAGEFGSDHEWLVLAPGSVELASRAANIRRIDLGGPFRAASRLYTDQVRLRRLVHEERVDAILATGNFGMLRPPVPQVLLNRNALYFCKEYLTQLRDRGEIRSLFGTVLRRRLALASIHDSDVNIVPTVAFGEQIRPYLNGFSWDRFRVLPHGFDHDRFVRPTARLDPALQARLDSSGRVQRILMVSHYNYFRNFETLLRGFALLLKHAPGPVELILTTQLAEGLKDHGADTSAAAKLMYSLGISEHVNMLGAVPHSDLYALYRQSDVVVCPSFAESFGHPMVEAMASGIPIVASDLASSREICGSAAVYFDTFNPASLANRLRETLGDPQLAFRMSEQGRYRARDFCWKKHFRSLLGVLREVTEETCPVNRQAA